MTSAERQILDILQEIKGAGTGGSIGDTWTGAKLITVAGVEDFTIRGGSALHFFAADFVAGAETAGETCDFWFQNFNKFALGIRKTGAGVQVWPTIPGLLFYATRPTGSLGHMYTECFAGTGGLTDNASSANKIMIVRSRGSYDSPAAVASGDVIGEYGFVGRDAVGSYGTDCVLMRCTAQQDHAPGAKGVKLEMLTCANGSSTLVARLTFNSSGNATFSGTILSPTLVTPALGTPTSGVLTSCTGLVLTSGVTGVLPMANGGTGFAGAAAQSALPYLAYVKGVTVLTAGAPADIATISVPFARWRLASTAATAQMNTVLAETAAGTLAGASFFAGDASGGGGTAMTAAVAGPASAGTANGWSSQAATNISTSNTIYIRQTANSANAGTMSFYLWIYPLP